MTANNSDLGEILSDVAHLTGMKIDGPESRDRVFGVYGPGNPRQVLTELLEGQGYDFMLVGDTAGGAPREVLLTARSAAPPQPGHAMAAPENSDSSEEGEDAVPAGPGAILHVPPSVAQQADDSQKDQRVQQNLERLQQMRQGAAQQQQQSQPQ